MRKNKICAFGMMVLVLGAGTTLLSMSASLAQDTPATTSTVELVENADRTASTYGRQNPGIAVAVFLGTESVVTPEQIKTILTREFVQAGVDDPIMFFFDQNDVPGTGVAYHYDGYANGPFNLKDARPQAVKIAKSYMFRKEKGLLSYSTTAQ